MERNKNEYIDPEQHHKTKSLNILDQVNYLASSLIRPDYLSEKKSDEDPRKR